MDGQDNSYISGATLPEITKSRTGKVPCQNCGKLVIVSLPFIGCVFCRDCATQDTGWNDGSEQFYEKRR